jgi:hypothetical protein
MHGRVPTFVAIAFTLGAAPGRATDADNGQRLAQRWCAGRP